MLGLGGNVVDGFEAWRVFEDEVKVTTDLITRTTLWPIKIQIQTRAPVHTG